MPTDDLKQHATSQHDFYALLGVEPASSEAEVRRAYRKTALKYHPDKNVGNPEAVEKFHLLQIAYDVLSDPAVKSLYDNARAAREQKLRHAEMFEGKRRQMKEDLERRESGAFKRKRDQHESAEEKLEREIQRLAEDGRRRRREREEMLNREKLEEEERLDQEQQQQQQQQDGADSQDVKMTTPEAATQGGVNVPEIDRTVKVRWVREGRGEFIDKDRLSELFGRFGPVESTLLLKDKKRRVGESGKKKVMATGIIVFSSIVGAHAAVEDSKKQTGDEWDVFDSVFWAADKEPDFSQSRGPRSSPEEQSSPSTPAPREKSSRMSFPGLDSAPITPLSSFKSKEGGDGLRRVPSFASFTSAGFKTPVSSPFAKGNAQSPSLEEITLIRLKNAEKKRLEEQIRREEAAAEAAEREA